MNIDSRVTESPLFFLSGTGTVYFDNRQRIRRAPDGFNALFDQHGATLSVACHPGKFELTGHSALGSARMALCIDRVLFDIIARRLGVRPYVERHISPVECPFSCMQVAQGARGVGQSDMFVRNNASAAHGLNRDFFATRVLRLTKASSYGRCCQTRSA